MKIKLFTIFFLFILKCHAQQEPHFTMYWNNLSSFNPAATGIFGKHYIALNGRAQWVGISGSPRDLKLVYDLKLASINSGIGVNYLYGKAGYSTIGKLNLNYSYQIKLGEDRVLSTGLAVSWINTIFDFSQFLTVDPEPLFPEGIVSYHNIDFNFGGMYKSKRMLIGISATQLAKSRIGFYTNARHYFLNFAYDLPLSSMVSLKPGFLYKTDTNFSTIGINTIVTLNKKYWMGVNYIHDIPDGPFNGRISVGPMLGIDIKEKFKLGYAFDYPMNSLSKITKGSHEIVFACTLK